MQSVMNRKVLVLNSVWSPISVVSLKKAMCLVTNFIRDTNEPKARIIDALQDFRSFTWKDWSKLIPRDDEPVLRSANIFRIPEIILLSKYSGFPQQDARFSRRTIYRRDGNQCQYCGIKPGTSELSIDHIIPKSRGGLTIWENVCLSCTDCNRKKGNKTMKETGFKFFHPDFKPKKPKLMVHKNGNGYRCDSWEKILGISFWEIEICNDN